MTSSYEEGGQKATSWNSQIENRNFLSPIGFRFVLADFPKIAYFSQSANIPGIGVNTVEQHTMLGRPIPWDSHGLNYEPFNLNFLVDENLENYLILHNWIRGLGIGEDFIERSELEATSLESRPLSGHGRIVNPRADGSLAILNSNFQTNFWVTFKDMFPVSLNALEFSATIDGTEYAMAQASFRYTSYNITDTYNKRRKQLE